MKLRKYTDEDVEKLFRLDEQCFPLPFRFSLEAMRRFASSSKAFVPMAEMDGELVGFVILHVEGTAGYIVTLDVAEAYRRKGIAQALMQQVEAHAREAACEVLVLHVFDRNQSAIAFYDHAGFEEVDRDENFYGEGLHALVYRRLLT
ncbi:MAG: GNAT family N-acetyltransferase [Bryocella sp.]